jgi:hypothetical protein
MELHLKIIGAMLIVLAFVHVIFPRQFEWKTELSGLQLINRQLMYVHTFFIALVVFLMGLLCLTSSSDLVHTTLGNRLSLGLAIFWTIRLIFQFFVYSSSLWRGKRFETSIHILFSFFWTYFTFIFWMSYFSPQS